MVTVGDRVKETIDYMSKSEVVQALTPICIALDITSQRHAGAKRSGKALFKRYIQDYLWLITYVGFPGLMTSKVRVPFNHPDLKLDQAGTVGIEDIIYHVIRCSSVHSDEKESMIVWNDNLALGINQHGQLVLSTNLVWGFVSAVVFSPKNVNESIPPEYWLRIGQFSMFISELWGRVDLAKRIVKHRTGISIP